MASNPFDEIAYRDNLKAVSFVSDSEGAAKEKAVAWINGGEHGSIHVAGTVGGKTGVNICVATVVYSDA